MTEDPRKDPPKAGPGDSSDPSSKSPKAGKAPQTGKPQQAGGSSKSTTATEAESPPTKPSMGASGTSAATPQPVDADKAVKEKPSTSAANKSAVSSKTESLAAKAAETKTEPPSAKAASTATAASASSSASARATSVPMSGVGEAAKPGQPLSGSSTTGSKPAKSSAPPSPPPEEPAKTGGGGQPPSSPPPSPPVVKGGSSKGGGCLTSALVAVIAAVAVIGALFLGREMWLPHVAPQLDPVIAELPAVVALREQVTTVAGKTDEFTQSVEALSSGQDEVGDEMAELRSTLEERGQAHGRKLDKLTASGQDVQAQLADATARIEALEELLEAIREAEPASAGGVDDTTSALADRIRRLETQAALLSQIDKHDDLLADQEQQITALTTRIADLGDVSRENERIEKLEARMQSLEEIAVTSQEAAVEAASVTAAVGELREALSGSGPYAAELARVERLGLSGEGLSGALAAIKPYAEKGVPTVADLYRRYPDVASSIVQADNRVEGEDWSARAVNSLMSLVTVRHTGDGGSTVDRHLTDAEAAMDAGDLASAKAALERIDGPMTELAKAWIADAEARIAANRALTRLQLYAVSMRSVQGG